MTSVLTAAIRAWASWFRARKTAPLAEARARRASEIRRNRAHHRPVTDLYAAQRKDTLAQLRAELRHR